jgi:acetolactate synthase-1/2/3 large subunit
VRSLLKQADLIIALGTEMGQTDYDMYEDGFFPTLKNLVRVDIDKNQLKQSPAKTKKVRSDVSEFCNQILKHIKPRQNNVSKSIVKICKNSAQLEIPQHYDACNILISTIVKILPDAIIVGDSTQPTYYGNLFCEITNTNRWFNSATGFGTLGYAAPASIGAQLACPEKPVICIIGDGGLQFSLGELGTAIDENVPVIFLVWNNAEYKEIRTYMESQSITPIGISPKPPDLKFIAKSYGIEFTNIKTGPKLSQTLLEFRQNPRPLVIEITENTFKG